MVYTERAPRQQHFHVLEINTAHFELGCLADVDHIHLVPVTVDEFVFK